VLSVNGSDQADGFRRTDVSSMPRSRWKSRRPGGWQSLPRALILRGTIAGRRYRSAGEFWPLHADSTLLC